MVVVSRPPRNRFVYLVRKLYNPLGFSKGYNALLCKLRTLCIRQMLRYFPGFIFDGAFLGFTLARFPYLNIWGNFCPPVPKPGVSAAPGECYWYETLPRNRIGIILHLGTILPAALLAVFQFVPFIRHKAILYHRIAGYLIFLLVAISDAGAIMAANHAFGGDLATQMFIGFLVIITTISLVFAYINIKRLQIDQHRAWMLRAWFYFASIITLRIIQIIAVTIEGSISAAQQHGAFPCSEMLNVYGGNTTRLYSDYPACSPANAQWAPDGYVAVKGDISGNNVMQAVAALSLNFGMAGILAFFLHAFGIEIYLKLTPRESERLRQVSYERQLERGFKNPGSAGLVVERFGDADPWIPMDYKGAAPKKTDTRDVDSSR